MAGPRRTELTGILSGTRERIEAETAARPDAKKAVPKPGKGREKPPKAATAAPAEKPAATRGKGPTKETTVQQTIYYPPAVHKQLRELAFSEETKMHTLVMEGLDLLFEKRGMRSIARLTGKS